MFFCYNLINFNLKEGAELNELLLTDVKSYKADDSFIGKFQNLISDTVIPYQYQVLCDEVEGATESHVIKNFEDATRVLLGK